MPRAHGGYYRTVERINYLVDGPEPSVRAARKKCSGTAKSTITDTLLN